MSEPLIAMSVQQAVGIAIAVVTLVAWVAYSLASNVRPVEEKAAEIELAPNRKPLPDDEFFEGPRLEKWLGWGLVMSGIVAVGLPLYWLAEPGRQAGAVKEFERRAEHRGERLFASASADPPGFGCADCHGNGGPGGVAPATLTDPVTKKLERVQWTAPALNTVTLRYSEEQIKAVIIYGRANTPMPAWGLLGGGPLNDQQVDDLYQYLLHITIPSKEARAQADTYLAAARKDPAGFAATEGELLFNGYCARCHTKGWSYGKPDVSGGGAYGFNLTNAVTLRQFPNVEDHVLFVTEGAQFGKPYGERGVGQTGGGGMPYFGRILTPEQIKAIIEYERGL